MPQPPIHPSSTPSERRRHPRVPVLQRALLAVRGGKPFPGEIRDFCPEGLYLKLSAKYTAQQANYPWAGQPIEVKFAANHRDGHPVLKLAGTIVRGDGAGLGIAFAGPEASEALEALREIALADQATQPRPPQPEIERACQQALDGFIPELMRQFGARIFDDLGAAADRAANAADRTAFFDAVTLFKPLPALVERFRAHALDQARHYSIAHGPEPANPRSLSLMEQGLFEDWLNLVGETARQDAAFESELRCLEQRLSRIAPAPIDAKNNPYGPLALGRAFRKAIEDLLLGNAARAVAYKTLGRALQETLGPFYRQLEELTDSLHGDAAAHPARESRPQDAPPSPSPPLVAAPARPVATKPDLSATFAALNQLGAAGKTGGPAGSKTGDWAQALAFASEVFQNRLQPAQVNSLQMLGAVLAQIRVDPAIPPGLQPVLKQWQLPLLKLAIRDPQLLNDPGHPARQLLDILDQVALAADSHGQIDESLGCPLREWSDRLGRDSVREPGLVAQAAEALRILTAPLLKARNLRIQRLRKVCESQQRVQEARRQVATAIELRLAGMTIPRLVCELLDLGWREWLTLAHLRTGDTGQDWRDSLKALDNLLIWLGPGGRLPDPVAAYRQIEFIEERLYPVSLDIPASRRWIDTLAGFLVLGRRPEWLDEPGSTQIDADNPARPPTLRVRAFRVGDWLRLAAEPPAASVLRLIWIGGSWEHFVFADRQGRKGLELDAEEFDRQLADGLMRRDDSLEFPLSERVVSGLIQNVQEQLRQQAHYDSATGFLNAKGLAGWLAREFSNRANAMARHTLCVIEIEQARGIAGLCGLEESDRLLREFAGLCRDALGSGILLARLGDNRFAALFQGCDGEQGRLHAEKLVVALGNYRFQWENRSFALGAYVGLVAFRVDGETAASVFKRADTACLRAKEYGINQILVQTEDDPALSARERGMDWAGRIDNLLADKRLYLRGQKIIALGDPGEPAHYEVLLGAHDDHGRLLPAGEFIAAAERWGRIADIDRAQVDAVFAWIRRRPERFAKLGGLSVNLSGQSVNSEEFMDFLHQRLVQADWPLEKLTFEITETAAITEFGRAECFIRRMRRHGCKFALDDFGSGFASYAYLKNLQVDYLKIDGVFVRDLAHSETDYAMVKSMNEVGHSLGIKTIAEYVESAEILAKLRQLGVDYGQGFFIGKPFPLEELA